MPGEIVQPTFGVLGIPEWARLPTIVVRELGALAPNGFRRAIEQARRGNIMGIQNLIQAWIRGLVVAVLASSALLIAPAGTAQMSMGGGTETASSTVGSIATQNQFGNTILNPVGNQTRLALDKTRQEFSGSNEFGTKLTPIAGGMRMQGNAAGDGFGYPWGLWGSYQHSEYDDDFVATRYDAEADSVLFGADFSPWDNFVAGVAFGYESTDIETTFNAGEQEIDTFSVIPYFGGYLSDNLGVDVDVTVDFAIGYARVDIDQFRTSAADGSRVTSSTDANRFFMSGNLSVGEQFGNLYASGRTGILYARDNVDGYTESGTGALTVADDDVGLGRFSIGGDLAYSWDAFEPFANAVWQYDFEHEEIVTATVAQPANDPNDVRLGLGVRFIQDTWSGSFEWNTTADREDFDENTFSFLFRAEF